MEDLFRQFWWLIFPLFGMVFGLVGMIQGDKRTKDVLDLIRSYTDQGKEPPPELLKLVSQSMDSSGAAPSPQSNWNSNAWSFIVFAAMAAAFSVGYYYIRAEEWSWAFLIIAVAMGVMAVGALFILLNTRNK